MAAITVTRTIPAPVDEVFDWVSDASHFTESSRIVLRSRLAREGLEAPYGTGAIRVVTWLIGHFTEHITAYQRPHAAAAGHFDYLVTRSFPPARHEGGRVTCTSAEAGTRVEWTTAVRMPFVPDAIVQHVALPIFAHVFRRVLLTCERRLCL
ncbi:MAG: SRPBCC family protein [Aeromicrobium sp.]|uniref:SRPBCC family protein n=1 Tax=Aeromicrobium sp. TaxID=1871063 RepID=UPI0039E26A8B